MGRHAQTLRVLVTPLHRRREASGSFVYLRTFFWQGDNRRRGLHTTRATVLAALPVAHSGVARAVQHSPRGARAHISSDSVCTAGCSSTTLASRRQARQRVARAS